MKRDKFILDACCGGRMFWFNKKHPNTIYMDIRRTKNNEIKKENWKCDPDIIASYTNVPFQDETFNLVVWDVPHKIKNDGGIISKKYGFLGPSWQRDLKNGFNELMRVLKYQGVLNFKFSDVDIPIKEILNLFPIQPLYGTITKKGVNTTYWFIFMKLKDPAHGNQNIFDILDKIPPI